MTGVDYSGYRSDGSIGLDLKSGYNDKDRYGNVYWGSGFGSNEYNFKALPAGYHPGAFYSLGQNAYFWTSTQKNGSMYWTRVFYKGIDGVDRLALPSNTYLSVRCIKD